MLLGGGKDVCEKVRTHVEAHYKRWLIDLFGFIKIDFTFILLRFYALNYAKVSSINTIRTNANTKIHN